MIDSWPRVSMYAASKHTSMNQVIRALPNLSEPWLLDVHGFELIVRVDSIQVSHESQQVTRREEALTVTPALTSTNRLHG